MDPRLGTDTSGPGEVVFAMRFNGKPVSSDWVVYKQFPGIRGELQGGVLEGFDLFFWQFSVNFPDEFSVKNG